MTTAPDIDPRLVCVACGWGVGRDSLPGGFAHVRGGPAANEYLDELCDGSAWMSAVLEHLDGPVSLRRDGDEWCALRSGHQSGAAARAGSPHEAVFALATSIGRHLEQSS